MLIVRQQLPAVEPPPVPSAASGTTEQSQPQGVPPPPAAPAAQYSASQSPVATVPNGASTVAAPSQQPQQSMPQYPPGVKVPATEQAAPGPSQQAVPVQVPRPSSATAQQMIPPQQQRASVSGAFPGSLSDLVISFENVKQKGSLMSMITRRRLLGSLAHCHISHHFQ